MARSRQDQPTLEALMFSSPEQKLLRLLLSEPNTSFSLRIIASKLKGIRGLGGAEGITQLLQRLRELGLIEDIDNGRGVRLRDESPAVQILKTFLAVCELEGLRDALAPVSRKGILYGARAAGLARSDSDYDLVVVSETPEEVKKITGRHPMAKQIVLSAFTPEAFGAMDRQNPSLAQKVSRGIVVWGSAW